MKRGKFLLIGLVLILSSFFVLGVCEDADGDGYGVELDAGCAYPTEVDCNDYDPAINPGATEVFNAVDDNCDGEVDEGLVFECTDNDLDGYNSSTDHASCPGENCCSAAEDLDCDDSTALANPSLEEICGDGIDNDCDPETEDACPEGEEDTGGEIAMPTGCSLMSDMTGGGLYWADCNGNPISTANEGDSVYLMLAADRCDVNSLVDYAIAEDDIPGELAVLTEEYLLSPIDATDAPNANAWAAGWTAAWNDGGAGADPEYYFTARLSTADEGQLEGTSPVLTVSQCPPENPDCGNQCVLEGGFVSIGGRSARSGESSGGGYTPEGESCRPAWDCSAVQWSECDPVTRKKTRDISLCVYAGEGDSECQATSRLQLESEKPCMPVVAPIDTGRAEPEIEEPICGDGFCEAGEDEEGCPEDCAVEEKGSPWLWMFLIFLLIALIIGGVLYYLKMRKKGANVAAGAVGKSPFESENDEKAVINYIKMSKSKGVPDAQIKAMLKKSNWTDVQINYAFKNLNGKKPAAKSAAGAKAGAKPAGQPAKK